MLNVCLALLLTTAAPAAAQPQAATSQWDPATRQAAQREAMAKLAFLDGAWRGRAVAAPKGDALVQTERVGPLLDGTLKLVEGRGYDEAGKTAFNALGVISYDPATRRYSMRAYAMGYAADYSLEVRPDGFAWTQPAGPGAMLRHIAIVRDGEWHEVSDRIAGDAPPVRTLEMRLRRIGPTDWPADTAVPPR